MSQKAPTTTYRYLSVMKSTGGNKAWGHDDGERTVIYGKKPEVWMPNVPGDDGVIGVRYERVNLHKLPERMKSEEISDYLKEERPAGVYEHIAGAEN